MLAWRSLVHRVCPHQYDRAIEQHRKTSSGIVGKRQAMQLAESASCDFVDFYAHRAVKDEQTDDLLILSFDGKGLVLCTGQNIQQNLKGDLISLGALVFQ